MIILIMAETIEKSYFASRILRRLVGSTEVPFLVSADLLVGHNFVVALLESKGHCHAGETSSLVLTSAWTTALCTVSWPTAVWTTWLRPPAHSAVFRCTPVSVSSAPGLNRPEHEIDHHTSV
jgi:hypothetical protein